MEKLTSKFPRDKRLLNRKDFAHVFDRAHKVAHGPFVVLVRPNDRQHPRLGVVLSKKKVSRAVDRNRLRRLIRESFRHQIDLGNLDLVVLPKAGINRLSNEDLLKGLIKQWQQCNTWLKKRSLS